LQTTFPDSRLSKEGEGGDADRPGYKSSQFLNEDRTYTRSTLSGVLVKPGDDPRIWKCRLCGREFPIPSSLTREQKLTFVSEQVTAHLHDVHAEDAA
jgi:hypothetical protein